MKGKLFDLLIFALILHEIQFKIPPPSIDEIAPYYAVVFFFKLL